MGRSDLYVEVPYHTHRCRPIVLLLPGAAGPGLAGF
jgi:hypothetical protein